MGGGHRCFDWFSVSHVALVKKINYVALLGENKVSWGRGGFHAEEEVKRA